MATNKHIIDVQTKGAKKSEKQIKGVGGALGGLAKQAGIAAAAYFGTRALLNGVKQSIDLFAKQELAEKKLEAALGRTSNALLNQAKALQQVTMFGDETIIEAQALIGSFVKEEEAIASATKATLDLAAAKGMELTVAADLVSKTLGSSTNALSRYGIEVTGAVGSTERLESLTGNLAAVFGGQATEQTDTLAGAMAQMNNAIGDTQEAMGEALEPLMKSFAVATKNAAEAIGNYFQRLNESRMDRFIGEMQELGMETEKYELTLKRIEINDRLGKLKNGLTENKEAQDELNEKLEGYKIIMEKGFQIEQDRAEFENKEFKDREFREGTRITNREIAFKEERKKAEKEINDLKEQIQLQTEINKLEKEEEQIVKKLNDANDDRSEFVKLYAKLKQSESKSAAEQEIANAFSASKANLISQIMKLPFPFNLVAAATAGDSIDKLFAKNGIKAAQYGADFVTDGPQMMLVGEGSGPERVQVTPLADPNLDGPQGAGVNVTFNNPIMTQDFVENQLMDNIKESLRLGGDIGIN